MSLINRRIPFVYQLSSNICNFKPSFDTLNSSSEIIASSNVGDLDQLRSEDYQYIFVYEITLEDLLSRNASAARVVSNPIFEFMYNVNNFSSYPTITSLANGPAGGNLPTPNSSSSLTLNQLITNSKYGSINGILKIMNDCLANGFTFTTPFSPHIFQSNYNVLNPVTGVNGPVERLVFSIINDSNKVLLFGVSFPPQLFF